MPLLLSTDTFTFCEAVTPLELAQVSVKVVVAVRPFVVEDPLVASLPDHPPEAVQLVALVEDQLSVELPPLETVAGLAVSVTVGACSTVTVADWEAEPPAPLQVRVKFVVVVRGAVLCEPLVG